MGQGVDADVAAEDPDLGVGVDSWASYSAASRPETDSSPLALLVMKSASFMMKTPFSVVARDHLGA